MGIQKMQVKEKVDEASAPKVPKTGQIQIQKPDPAAIEAPAAPSIPAPKVDEAAKKKDEGADAAKKAVESTMKPLGLAQLSAKTRGSFIHGFDASLF